MKIANDKVNLDEILKSLFSTSDKVLINLLNGIFDENFREDEVSISIANNEFIGQNFDIIIGDKFFEIGDFNGKKAYFHLEFQTKNDSTMVIRMFEYGFKKAAENSILNAKNGIKTIYFPRQKVIFFEENKNIEDSLDLNIVFPDDKVVLYSVGVMKYWEFTDEDLINKKMYPLIPLQLFNLRKELKKAQSKNDIHMIKKLSYTARDLAERISNESKDLFDKHEILGEDFHKMLLAVNNLIQYLNRNYLNDDRLEEEVTIMTKTLYDPEVEKRGIEKGIKQGIEEGIKQGIEKGIEQGVEKGRNMEKIKNAKKLLDVLDDKTISEKLELDESVVKSLREEASSN